MYNDSSADSKFRGLLETFSKIIVRVIEVEVGLIFDLWLITASNMGPAYFPRVLDGELDFWIRISLLGLGPGIWISSSVWLLWLILGCFYDLVRPNP